MRVVKHARACAAKGTLIMPCWKSAPFWPVLCPDGVHFVEYVKRWAQLQFSSWIFQDGHSGNNIGTAFTTDTSILALFLDFNSAPRAGKAGFCTFDDSGRCSACALTWSVSGNHSIKL